MYDVITWTLCIKYLHIPCDFRKISEFRKKINTLHLLYRKTYGVRADANQHESNFELKYSD